MIARNWRIPLAASVAAVACAALLYVIPPTVASPRGENLFWFPYWYEVLLMLGHLGFTIYAWQTWLRVRRSGAVVSGGVAGFVTIAMLLIAAISCVITGLLLVLTLFMFTL